MADTRPRVTAADVLLRTTVVAIRRLAATVEVDPPTMAAVDRTAVADRTVAADRMAEVVAVMGGDIEIALELFPA
jgi:hypothetical protein